MYAISYFHQLFDVEHSRCFGVESPQLFQHLAQGTAHHRLEVPQRAVDVEGDGFDAGEFIHRPEESGVPGLVFVGSVRPE